MWHMLLWLSNAQHISFLLNRFLVKYRFLFQILIAKCYSQDWYLKANDILLLFVILFLWLNLENHLHSQNAIIASEYKKIIFQWKYLTPLYKPSFWNWSCWIMGNITVIVHKIYGVKTAITQDMKNSLTRVSNDLLRKYEFDALMKGVLMSFLKL